MLTIEEHPATATETGTPTDNKWRTRTKVLVATGALVTAFAAATAIDLATAHSTHATAHFRQPITAVDAKIDAGSLRIIGTDDPEITVDATVHKGLHSPSRSVTMRDGRLVIRSDCSLAAISTTCAVDYVVHVPKQVAVKARGNGSDVVISAVDGDVDVTVNGGRVDMAFDAAPHHVKASSNGGRINVGLPDDGTSYRVGTHTNGGRPTSGSAPTRPAPAQSMSRPTAATSTFGTPRHRRPEPGRHD